MYTDRQTIHAMLRPERYESVPEIAVPTGRRMVERYGDAERRGYLAGFKGMF